ncbi:MAG: secondary thiamine-phosphate synthase enzyme YjbQ [Candidatus Caldatribacteriota bacterium]|nr:secondary thiamine-phosphate synthase enzyme YjbQ [Candidatus Caldatribacteriota bacterium]
MLKRIPIKTNTRTQILDITIHIQKVVDESKVSEGICYIFVPHTTAGITINENADPSVKSDILMELNKIVPFKDNYAHKEGNSAAHIKASLMGFSQNIIINKGSLVLGTWQGIYFFEFDGPRTRNLYVKIVED